MKVTVLSKENCLLCDQSISILLKNNIQFEKIVVSKDKLFEICEKRVPGWPQILIDGKYVGDGFVLEEYLQEEWEPILEPNTQRFTMFPIQHSNLWEMYKKAQGSFWTAEELILVRTLMTGTY